MHRVVALVCAMVATACAPAPSSEEAGGAPLDGGRLVVRGPATRLEPGVLLADQVLRHAVVEADAWLTWSGLQVDSSIPPDFWAEVQGYLLDVTAGTEVLVRIDGLPVQTLTKRIDAEASQMDRGNEVRYVADADGTVLVMVMPSEIRPGSDHITFDIVAWTTTPSSIETMDWRCASTYFASGDGCDCGCGIADPDCGGTGCTEPGCNDPACGYCYDADGRDVGCAAPEW